MASPYSLSIGGYFLCKAFLFVTLLSSANSLSAASAFEFDVGGENGWVVPSSKNTQIYNQWASKNRFKIGDTLIFKYKKDSVMVVAEADYEHCNSLHPIFFSNKGNTEFALDHSGTFYFISGVSGHCERGQKMIVKVLSHSEAPGGSPSPGNRTGTTPPGPSDSSGAIPNTMAPKLVFFVILLGSSFFFFF